MKVRITLILLTTLALSNWSTAQNLLESRESSYYTYIFRISDKEAKKVYGKDIWEVDSSFFHTLIDRYPTDSTYNKVLPKGHYLKTYSYKEEQKTFITSIQDFNIYIINNNTDLQIRIFDLHGNPIKDAKVKCGWKRLRYNKKVDAYVDKKSNKKGLLEVNHNGFTAYYNLSREFNNSAFKRNARKVIYGSPVQYVWKPVRFVLFIPIDGVKSVVYRNPVGTIGSTAYFFEKAYHKVACIFDDYYCGYYNNYKFEQKHKGYMVFNKPKYLPGDTVKFKAFITKKGKPIKKQVLVNLYANRKNILLKKLDPYRPGAYTFEFTLHDSLNLKLDQWYSISLDLNENKTYLSESFKYEDYELNDLNLELTTDEGEHHKGEAISIFVRAKDANELNILDGQLTILVSPTEIHDFHDTRVFIPDTLLYFEQKLDPVKDTEISIDDLDFPAANFDYNVHVSLTTSDNSTISEDLVIYYNYYSSKFDFRLKGDSITFEYLENGKSQSKQVELYASDNFDNDTLIYSGELPYTLNINPYYANYIIASEKGKETLEIPREDAEINVYSRRTHDSLFVYADNPHNIPLTYYIYKKNKKFAAGYTKDLNFKAKANTKKPFVVSIRYLWAGKILKEDFEIRSQQNHLFINVEEPQLIYPGQTAEIKVEVKDYKGKPVKDVDLTAFSVTSKFDYNPESPPLFHQKGIAKYIINNFDLKDFNSTSFVSKLDYESWKMLAGIDSIEYYKFLYPGKNIYRYEYATSDSITQFAPFVIEDGVIEPIHVIYVDRKPVYFSWSTHASPYAFRIDSSYHKIKLRLTEKVVTLDSVYFKEGLKTIFSIDPTQYAKDLWITNAKSVLSSYEKNNLYRYIFPYRYHYPNRIMYINNNDNIHLLEPGDNYRLSENFAGPVSGRVAFHLIDSFSTYFQHEPSFEYDFYPDILKMRSMDSYRYPKYLYSYSAKTTIEDTVLTKKALQYRWKEYLRRLRRINPSYNFPKQSSKNTGTVWLEFYRQSNEETQEQPLNTLVFRYDNSDFVRIYPGKIKDFYDLKEGYYQLIFFYAGSRYQVKDSLYVKQNGINFFKLEQDQEFKKDTFSIRVSKLIEKVIYGPKKPPVLQKLDYDYIRKLYSKQFVYDGPGKYVDGFVYSNEDNQPIPGVNVIVKGTTIGTVTDLNGYYHLKVPFGRDILIFSFIGLTTEEKYIGSGTESVFMQADIQQLSEVVVVGYGVQTKKHLTAAVSKMEVDYGIGIPITSQPPLEILQGKIPGVTIQKNAKDKLIEIRGVSAEENIKPPLYVIDGEIYNGNIEALELLDVKSMKVIGGEEALKLYGEKGTYGVVLISTNQPMTSFDNKGADFDEAFYASSKKANALRNNFSDYAFWQPGLTTDKNGQAKFEVTFPDDVTSWKTYYMAVSINRQSGEVRNNIKSYKPLMARLATPRFLLEKDTTYVIGKSLNYLPDTALIITAFKVNGEEKMKQPALVGNAVIDSMLISGHGDSLQITYSLERDDGYFDGEQKDIPLYPLGIEKSKGAFLILNHDTTFAINPDTTLAPATIYARANAVDVIEDEIQYLINYRYECNEQLASKLKGLIALKKLRELQKEEFKYDNKIKRTIKKLEKNQKDSGLWGWWASSGNNLWISKHVIEALMQASENGYETDINEDKIVDHALWELDKIKNLDSKLQILDVLKLLDVKASQDLYLRPIEKHKNLKLNQRLKLIALQQHYGLPYTLDTIMNYLEKSYLGSIHFSDSSLIFNLTDNDIQNTLLAYQVLKNDTLDHSEILEGIRYYLLNSQNNGHWRNTFEASKIIENILPDLIKNEQPIENAQLIIKSVSDKPIDAFPYQVELDNNNSIEITKTGNMPLYLSYYQRFWDKDPEINYDDFEITTSFTDSVTILEAGKATRLLVDVRLKKDADYLMINIPVPAGCSYGNKKVNSRIESHREYFKNETSIFIESLKAGSYRFEVELLPRFSGTYHINPAKVELMYFPIINGHNAIKTVRIENK